MTITLLVFSTRLPTLTLEQYKTHYENNHVPLISSLLSENNAHPLVYTRDHISPSKDFLTGEMEDPGLGFDCVAESIFEDQEHMERCMAELNKPEKKKLREEDEARFLDTKKLKAVIVDSKSTFPVGRERYTMGK